MADFKTTSVFLSLIAVCYAAVSIEFPNPNRSEGHCLPIAYNVGEMDYGESRSVNGHCVEANCQDDGGVGYASCGTVHASPPCRLTKTDLSKPYPQCCPHAVCG